MYQLLTKETEALASQIVDIAYKIHRTLGPGLLESVYERCFCYELSLRGIPYERQKKVPVVYEERTMDNSLRGDVLGTIASSWSSRPKRIPIQYGTRNYSAT